MSTDYDSPWKEALDHYFEAFLALLFPWIHAQLDWKRGYESLDKEFQQVVPEAESGRRYVDKLVKVWRHDGTDCWVLIHVEVQTTRDADFAERMYVYHYRIYDRYNRRKVASLAVLADEDANWRPSEFQSELFGCEAILRFPHVKLLDFEAQEALLETSDNPFAPIVLAHLKAHQTRDDPVDRRAWKLRLVRGLYERNLNAKDIRELFRVIDWLMKLPPVLDKLFWQDIGQIQEEKRMPFITTPERVGHLRGLREAIEALLQLRFGEEGVNLMPEIEEVYESDKLKAILIAVNTVSNPDELRRLWAPAPS